MFRNTSSGFQNGFRKIATFRKIHDVQIYDRIYGSKAIDSGPPNFFSLYSLFYTHTVHGYAQVHASIYIYIYRIYIYIYIYIMHIYAYVYIICIHNVCIIYAYLYIFYA